MSGKILSKKITSILLPIILFSFLAFLSVWKSFGLAQGGDDWGIHLLIWGIFDVSHAASYWNPLTYFCTYCPHYFFLSIIRHFFGYEHFYYFLASFIARVMAALSIFYLIKKLTKQTLPAILAGAFFATTYIGIETTDWAFNYNYYLGIGVMSIFIVSYWKAKNTGSFKHVLISGLLVFLSAVIAPARMHQLIPLLLIVETGWWISEGKKFNLKKAAIRIITAFVFYYLVLYGVGDLYIFLRDHFHIEIGPFFIGNGYGAKEWNAGRVRDGISYVAQKVSQGQSDIIIDPIATIGNFIMPDMLWSKIPFSQVSFFGKQSFTFLTYLFPISLIYGGLTFFALKFSGLKKKLVPLYILNLVIWLSFIYLLQKANINTFSYPRVAFSIIGGFSIIFTIWLFFILKKTKPVWAQIILLGMGLMFTPILFPWIIGPYGLISSWGRYAVQSGAGLAIWLAAIFYIVLNDLNNKKKFILLSCTYLLILGFFFMHIQFSNDYLAYVSTYRSREIDAKFWNYITTQVPSLDRKHLNVFLMLTDQESAPIAEAIRFGFYGRASIYYKVPSFQNYPFMVVNEYESILSSVYDGKYLTKQGRKPIPTTVNHIYAFELRSREMYNVTDQIRNKLNKDLADLKKGTRPLPRLTQ